MCVLVVEDDALIRLILVEELQEAGFHVKEAATGDQAIALLEEIDPPLAVLVTDIHMPGDHSGVDLAAYVHLHHPAARVIFTTGRPDSLRKGGQLWRNDVLVRKPYVPSEVIKVIQAGPPH